MQKQRFFYSISSRLRLLKFFFTFTGWCWYCVGGRQCGEVSSCPCVDVCLHICQTSIHIALMPCKMSRSLALIQCMILCVALMAIHAPTTIPSALIASLLPLPAFAQCLRASVLAARFIEMLKMLDGAGSLLSCLLCWGGELGLLCAGELEAGPFPPSLFWHLNPPCSNKSHASHKEEGCISDD